MQRVFGGRLFHDALDPLACTPTGCRDMDVYLIGTKAGSEMAKVG